MLKWLDKNKEIGKDEGEEQRDTDELNCTMRDCYCYFIVSEMLSLFVCASACMSLRFISY